MKVRELIAELLKHDQEAEVVTEGRGLGVSDVRRVIPGVAYKNESRPFGYGRYKLNRAGTYTPQDTDLVPVRAVYLQSGDNEDAVEE